MTQEDNFLKPIEVDGIDSEETDVIDLSTLPKLPEAYGTVDSFHAVFETDEESLWRVVRRGLVPAAPDSSNIPIGAVFLGGLIPAVLFYGGVGFFLELIFSSATAIDTHYVGTIIGVIFALGFLIITEANFIGDRFSREDKEIFANKLNPRHRRKAKKAQRENVVAAQNFLNSRKNYAKMYEYFLKLSQEPKENEMALEALREEWSNVFRDEQTAIEKKRQAEKNRLSQERFKRRKARQQRAAAERERRLKQEQEELARKKAEAQKLIQQVRTEIAVDNNGLVLGESSLTQMTGKNKNDKIQDKLKRNL